MASPSTDVGDGEFDETEALVGRSPFDHGRSYARKGRVLKVKWDTRAEATGSVLGQGAVYSTTAFFASDGRALALADGECSCPVGYNCKHVAAIVVAAIDRGLPSRRSGLHALQPVNAP